MDYLIQLISIALIILGFLGILLPIIPALPFMYLGIFLFAWDGDFQQIGITTLTILGIVAAFGILVDFFAGLLGATYSNASKLALYGAFIGGIIGLFFSIVGIIFGPLIGAAIGEYLSRRNLSKAGKVALGTFIGFIFGSLAKLVAAFILLFGFLSALLF